MNKLLCLMFVYLLTNKLICLMFVYLLMNKLLCLMFVYLLTNKLICLMFVYLLMNKLLCLINVCFSADKQTSYICLSADIQIAMSYVFFICPRPNPFELTTRTIRSSYHESYSKTSTR